MEKIIDDIFNQVDNENWPKTQTKKKSKGDEDINGKGKVKWYNKLPNADFVDFSAQDKAHSNRPRPDNNLPQVLRIGPRRYLTSQRRLWVGRGVANCHRALSIRPALQHGQAGQGHRAGGEAGGDDLRQQALGCLG